MNKNFEYVPHHVAHHFDSAEQEFGAAKLGMWVFLVQEILFFGGLFVAYAIFRYLFPDMFIGASKVLSWKLGTLNTIFLITSSFTMAMGIRSAQTNQRQASIAYLSATFMFAVGFLVVKYIEYGAKIHHGIWPLHWSAGPEYDGLQLFFGIYYALTGLHGLHVLIGMCLIGWIIYRSTKNEFYSEYYTPVEMVGLYWHLVDLIWIFLFPLLYLI
jgi:cytochrome c oxidase subunit 3